MRKVTVIFENAVEIRLVGRKKIQITLPDGRQVTRKLSKKDVWYVSVGAEMDY